MKKIRRIIEKNFKLLVRSKSSALIIILGPLLLISLLGLAFSNTEPYGVSVATYSPDYNDLVNSMIAKLDEQRFTIAKFQSEYECVQQVKEASAHICLVFPRDFQFSEATKNNITFHVDYSKMNLVWSVLEVISEKVSSRSAEISEDLTEQLVKSLQFTQNEVNTNLPNLVELSIKADQLNTLSEDMFRTANGIDFGLDTQEFKVSNLENALGVYEEKADKAVSKGLNLIEELEGNYDNFNFTASQQLAVGNLLDSTEEELLQLEDELNDLYAGGDTGTLIGDLIENINTKLEDTKAQLSEAANSKEIIAEDIKHSQSLLADTLEKINQLQASLDRINQDIKNIEILDPTQIVSPFTTTIQPIAVDTYFNYLFPTLIVLIIMITGILLGSTLVIVEKKSRAFFRNSVTPTHDLTYVLGTFLTAFFMLLFQVIIFLIIAGIFFKTNVFATFTTTPLILFFILTFFILAGMLVGALFHSEETTTLAAITFGSMFLFFSNAILPLESMPNFFRQVANLNPFVLSEHMLRQSIFFEFGFGELANKFLLLILYVALFFGSVVYLQHLMKVHTLYKIHKKKKMQPELAALEQKEYPPGWRGAWQKRRDTRRVKKALLRKKRAEYQHRKLEAKRQHRAEQATYQEEHSLAGSQAEQRMEKKGWWQRHREKKEKKREEKARRKAEKQRLKEEKKHAKELENKANALPAKEPPELSTANTDERIEGLKKKLLGKK